MLGMKFVFIRHGEATHNVAFREANDEKVFREEKYKDAPLTEAGIQQARELAEKLAEKYPGPVSIWSSPLTRAIQTAEELFEEMNCGSEIVIHDGLLEFQDAYHKCNARISLHDLSMKYPLLNTVFMPELPPFWFQSEPQIHTRLRMKMVVETMKEVVRCDTVIVVSHKNALRYLLNEDLGNCEFVEKTYEELFPAKA
jgi:broad specificity phosphatase PhoE